MRLSGKLIKDARIIKETVVVNDDRALSYSGCLEKCLIDVCRQLDIPVPMWLKRNTAEFARFKRTTFFNDQFIEKLPFDRFEIRIY